MTEEMAMLAVDLYYLNLKHVPERLKTDSLYIQAIQKDIKIFDLIENPSQEVINYYNLMNL